MVKWTKNGGGFTYDFTDFDKWVTFNKGLGIGDKIVIYSIAPWHGNFTYWENGTMKSEKYTVGSERWRSVWTDFLRKLIEHLMDKGWFDESYIGIDERGFSADAFDLIDSIRNIHDVPLKTAGAMDGFVNKFDLALRVTDLNVGDTAAAAHPTDFTRLIEAREAKGLRTTLYSCTEHEPGNFSLSAPVESYWSVVNAGEQTSGFLALGVRRMGGRPAQRRHAQRLRARRPVPDLSEREERRQGVQVVRAPGAHRRGRARREQDQAHGHRDPLVAGRCRRDVREDQNDGDDLALVSDRRAGHTACQ